MNPALTGNNWSDYWSEDAESIEREKQLTRRDIASLSPKEPLAEASDSSATRTEVRGAEVV